MKQWRDYRQWILAGFFIFAGILIYATSERTEQIVNNVFWRGEPGDYAREEQLMVAVGNDFQKIVSICIEPREYTNDELEDLAKRAIPFIVRKMLGENESIELIENDLTFFEYLEGFPFRINWEVLNPEYINQDGRIIKDEIFDTSVTFHMSYESFHKDYGIPIHAEPGEDKKKQLIEKVIEEKVDAAINDAMINSTNPVVVLPGSVDGLEIKYKSVSNNEKAWAVPIGFFIAVMIIVADKRDKRSKEEKNKEILLSDYPGILQRLSLYIRAGISIQNAWIKLCMSRQGVHEITQNYLDNSLYELKSGIPEEQVYRHFSEKTGCTEYIRLSALLSQNIEKGNTKLCELLDEETKEAYSERKRRAIRQGNEAGTKLLLPMLILLIDVLSIIMIPAFMNI